MIDWKLIGWGLFLIGLAFVAASLDDSFSVRDVEVLPEPPQHSGKVNYGKP